MTSNATWTWANAIGTCVAAAAIRITDISVAAVNVFEEAAVASVASIAIAAVVTTAASGAASDSAPTVASKEASGWRRWTVKAVETVQGLSSITEKRRPIDVVQDLD